MSLKEKAFSAEQPIVLQNNQMLVTLEDAEAAVEEARTHHLETAWPPRSVVETLITAVDHLLEHHDCDTDGHEQFRTASRAAFDWLTNPQHQPPPLPPESAGLVEEARRRTEGQVQQVGDWPLHQRTSARLMNELAAALEASERERGEWRNLHQGLSPSEQQAEVDRIGRECLVEVKAELENQKRIQKERDILARGFAVLWKRADLQFKEATVCDADEEMLRRVNWQRTESVEDVLIVRVALPLIEDSK